MITLNEYEEELKGKASHFVKSFTIPIFKNRNGKAILHGSGILYKNKESFYIISAYHVFDDGINNLYIPSKDTIVGASGRLYFPKNVNMNKGDELDIAVL